MFFCFLIRINWYTCRFDNKYIPSNGTNMSTPRTNIYVYIIFIYIYINMYIYKWHIHLSHDVFCSITFRSLAMLKASENNHQTRRKRVSAVWDGLIMFGMVWRNLWNIILKPFFDFLTAKQTQPQWTPGVSSITVWLVISLPLNNISQFGRYSQHMGI